MLFNSVEFLIFFPVVTLLFFLLPHKFRWFLLLVASCYFYMFFKPEYILILAFTIVIDYFAGILLEQEENLKRRKLYLIASLVANIGVLAIFKYFNFLNSNVSALFSWSGFRNPIPNLTWLLPIGLSFHTFQAMSYTIEVYRGKQKAERHFGIYALYVMFYPQLVAGPIERPQNIIHQFHAKRNFSYGNAVSGLNFILYGLFKKMVIADRLSVYVNQVYGNIHNASTLSAAIACVFFSVQIYCDFSGYSDIAIGTAKFMGYDLMINFNRPYLSQSISEFWTRWHISLSTWFKDYLYIPLGGSRNGKWKWYRNLIIVFMISGLWHGASWTFVVWGALHAVYNITGLLLKDWSGRAGVAIGLNKWKSVQKFLNRSAVFILVTFAWIFFRAENFAKASAMIHKLGEMNFSRNMAQLSAEKGPLNLVVSLLVIGMLVLSYKLPRNLKFKHNLLFACAMLFLIVILGKDVRSEFIYFQF